LGKEEEEEEEEKNIRRIQYTTLLQHQARH